MAKDCTNSHCSFQEGNVNEICKSEGWPIGHPVLLCDTKGYCCNCHCSCFAFGTLIAVPGGTKAIETILVKEKVLAAGSNLQWNEVTVEFSQGTSGQSISPFMMEISCMVKGEEHKLVSTKDQPFMMANRLLKRADKLKPGDELLMVNGTTTAITAVKEVTVETGVHHISTGTEKPTSLDNHLLNAEGFVVADYVVQLFQDELPQFFEKTSSAMRVGANSMPVRADVQKVALEQYLKSGVQQKYTYWHNTLLSHSLEMPAGTNSFVSAAQADQIRDFAPKHKENDAAVIAEIEYLFKIFKAFYPEVNFLLDWRNNGGNAFARDFNGQYYVIIQGGLARAKALQLGGHAIVIAHELGHLFGGDPKDPEGYSCDVQADFYGLRIVMRKVWYEDLYTGMAFPGINQVKKLFSYLSDAGVRVPGCVNATLSCRIDTMMAGITSQFLPPCAGGPAHDYLSVTSAQSLNAGEVDVDFNEAVDKATAEDIANYVFEPAVKIVQAQVSGTDPSMVRIIAELETGVEYRVTVSNVIAANNDQLDPKKSSAGFKAS